MPRMQRTSMLLPVLNLALEPQRRHQMAHPDKTFEAIVARCRDTSDNHAVLSGEDAALLDGLRTLLRCWSQTPGVSGVGWRSAIDLVTARVNNLLTVRRIQAQSPEVRDEPIADPVFVVGLPRTATTLCHHILAASAVARSPLLWEMYYPGSVSAPAHVQAKLIKETQKRMDMTLLLSRSWPYIHPTDAQWPEETYFLSMQAVFHLSAAPLEGYREWYFEQHDRASDFRFLKEALQVLQLGRERKRWVLKHPGNLFCLEQILEVFPDAKIVWTHRDPATVIGSLCSMNETLHRIHLKRRAVDLHAMGRFWLDLLSEGVEQARATRARLARPGSFIDVKYHELNGLADRRVPELFAQLGFPWGEEDAQRTKAAVRQAAAGRGRDGTRRHEYELSNYGLTPGDVEEKFKADYLRMCN